MFFGDCGREGGPRVQTGGYGHRGGIAEEYTTLPKLRPPHFQNRRMRPNVVHRVQDRVQLVQGNRRERRCAQSALLSVDATKRRGSKKPERAQ